MTEETTPMTPEFERGEDVASERWEVLDADGAPLGRIMLRGVNRFEPGEYHLVVGTCVQRPDGRILVTQRAPQKLTHPNMWEFPAGSALAGESGEVAAARELGEEAGIVVDAAELVRVGRVVERAKLFDVYFVRLASDPEVVMQLDEVSDFRWRTIDEVLDPDGPIDFAVPWRRRLAEVGERLRELASS
ncbi:NUDIX hydrolase [Gulosibacter macacae]|uniref:NUDIX hydrolase n=1 Tax=Gulosibacter macacae TaxID=2488791 RepID=A0A3P3VT70_9MICO|nr:NUDIX hydrolase [Gulosibacter macacae]RRJ85654.1 NUDIX hydrolase [Gulosibacter macacae]